MSSVFANAFEEFEHCCLFAFEVLQVGQIEQAQHARDAQTGVVRVRPFEDAWNIVPTRSTGMAGVNQTVHEVSTNVFLGDLGSWQAWLLDRGVTGFGSTIIQALCHSVQQGIRKTSLDPRHATRTRHHTRSRTPGNARSIGL
jgi:hypothetical protein